MLEEYRQLAQEILEFGQELGADQISTSLINTTSFQVEVRERHIDSLKESGSSGMYVSLCKEEQRSTISSNDLRMATLRPLMRSAMKALPYMGKDPYYTLPEPTLQGRAEVDLEFVDPNFACYDSSEKIQIALDLEETTLGLDPRLKTEQSYYSDMIYHTIHANSNGFLDGYTKSLYSIGISTVVEDHTPDSLNTGRKQTDGWYSSARLFDRLDPLEKIATKACHRTLRKLGAVKPKSCEVPVVFSPEMARNFMGSLATAMMGDHIFRKQSFLLNKLQQPIAHSQIEIKDHPLLPGMLGSRYFDSEGVKARPLDLVKNGVLQNYMLSTYAANKLKMRSTGHAGGISNLILTPGKYTEEELIASVNDGLYLTFMSGQGVNITTGDYSRGAQGIWIRNGKLAEAVSEFTVASTFYDMLNGLCMIGNEADQRNAILSPPFKIEKMSISGV